MYDIFYIGNPSELQFTKLKTRFPTAKYAEDVPQAKRKSLTKMLWIVYNNLVVDKDFDFNYTVDEYNDTYTHVFKNGDFYDGVCLMPKNSHHGPGELKARFYINKKFVPIQASKPVNSNFDKVFISYNEPNADENYERVLARFPDVKRIHGVKGIHQAHIAAASLCETDMFWIIDGDAQLTDEFSFNYIPEHHNKQAVHVWRSMNPVNGLVYGYGGVKLFPTEKTLVMDVSKPDMTTSISDKFVAMNKISNVTAFNTDPFNTWKSAFRECCKLSSKVIDRQKSEETNNRLRIWCTYIEGNPAFGEYALIGAKAGASYGARNKNKPDELRLINDFDWLQEKFDANI
jgi:hypothetical protein